MSNGFLMQRQDVRGGGLAAGPTAPAGRVGEEPAPISNESLFPGFTPGPVVPAAADAAFGHHFSEQPPIKLQAAQPNMTPAPKKYDYSKDKSGPEPPPPESTRRLNDMLREPEQTMCESRERPPAPNRKQPIVYDPRNSSYQPPAPSFGQSVKNKIGKVWSGIQSVLGPAREEPVYGPPLLQAENPDGTLADHMIDGSPLPDGPRAAGGNRG